ncbi:MAG: PAS domain-containing protein [bacterium]
MKDEEKTKEELISEMEDLRLQIAACRNSEAIFDVAKRALSKTMETFRALFEQASDSIFLMELKGDDELVITDANIAACRMHGYEKVELIGKPIRMLDTPDTAKYIGERAQRLMRSEKLTFEGEHLRKDGTVFPVEVSAQLITIGGKKYILAIDRDITERKSAEISIRKERDRAQLFFDFAGVMLVVINADQTVSMINKRGCEVLGYAKEEIIGKNWFDSFVPERMREEVRYTFRMLMTGEVVPVEYFENPIVNKRDEERIIAWHNTIIRDEKDDIIATLSSGTDITDQKNRDDALALNEMYRSSQS